MIKGVEHALVSASGLLGLPFAESSSSSLLKLAVFVVIFIGPAILNVKYIWW